jgi:hypothetical protein
MPKVSGPPYHTSRGLLYVIIARRETFSLQCYCIWFGCVPLCLDFYFPTNNYLRHEDHIEITAVRWNDPTPFGEIVAYVRLSKSLYSAETIR